MSLNNTNLYLENYNSIVLKNLNDVLHAQTVKPLGMHLTRLIPCTFTHVIRVSGYNIHNVIHTNTRTYCIRSGMQ